MNSKLEAIAAKAAQDLIGLVRDGEDKILAAWAEAEAQAVLEDTKPRFKLSVGITLDLDKDSMDTDLSWTVKHHLSVTAKIPDPNQPTLPLDKTTVTMRTEGMAPVTVTAEKFARMAAAGQKERTE